DRKSTRLNSSHLVISYAVFCLKKKKQSSEDGRWKMEGGAQTTDGAARSSISHPLSPVPAIGDANSIEWALGKKVGDTMDYTDERGRTFKLRLFFAVATSTLIYTLSLHDALPI